MHARKGAWYQVGGVEVEADMQDASACALENAMLKQGTSLMFGGELGVSENFEFI